MPRWKSRTLTGGELDFMRVLWSLGEAAPEQIQDALTNQGRAVTGGTIRNVLAVLMEKKYVARRKQGKAHLYRAAVSEEQALAEMAGTLLTGAFGGSESLLVAALLKNREVNPDELAAIEKLIAEWKRGEKK
jgi:BlaI family transcriptional regulator, penicillinase repressor